jgi:uncharacterized protein YeaO (DUF488 family)
MAILLKRAYEKPSPDDGLRILVERLWPRGVTKEALQLDLWMKDIAPSPDLRKWYSHDPEKWTEFQERYRAELRGNAEAVKALKGLLEANEKVTFVFAAHDEQRNSAAVLKTYLEP